MRTAIFQNRTEQAVTLQDIIDFILRGAKVAFLKLTEIVEYTTPDFDSIKKKFEENGNILVILVDKQ